MKGVLAIHLAATSVAVVRYGLGSITGNNSGTVRTNCV